MLRKPIQCNPVRRVISPYAHEAHIMMELVQREPRPVSAIPFKYKPGKMQDLQIPSGFLPSEEVTTSGVEQRLVISGASEIDLSKEMSIDRALPLTVNLA